MSGRDTALAEAKKLKAIMARHGVQASIELQIGRPWSGDRWYSRKHVLMNHHTAGSNTGLTPSLSLVKGGRSDLPGPLCNGYGGRDHVYRITCMGLANHPGAGGPLTVAGFTLPQDSARISSWGTEWEHDGVSAWPADMSEFMGRANAALCEYLDISPERSIEHKTWAPKRKVDRNRYTAATGQAEIRTWAAQLAPATTPPEDDMDWSEQHKMTAADARDLGGGSKAGDLRSVGTYIRYPPAVERLRRESAAQFGALTATVAALAKVIGDGAGITEAQITEAAQIGAQAALDRIGHSLLDDDQDTPTAPVQ